MSQTSDRPLADDDTPAVDSRPNGGDDALESEEGIGIGTNDEPDTFEPEDPSE